MTSIIKSLFGLLERIGTNNTKKLQLLAEDGNLSAYYIQGKKLVIFEKMKRATISMKSFFLILH